MLTRYLVSYDIADPERLRKVHGVVKASGVHVQDSLYEALATAREWELFVERLRAVVNEKEDRVLFINLGGASRRSLAEISMLGIPWNPQERGSIVL